MKQNNLMIIPASIILILFCIAGLLGVVFTGFGTLLVFIGAIFFAFMTHFSNIDLWTLGILFVFYLVGEILDYVIVAVAAKKMGASNAAVIGAFLGGLLGGAAGGSVFAGIGLIPGALAGIFLGAFLLEFIFKRDWKQSFKSGIGGLLGSAGSVLIKVFLVFGMFGVIAVKVFTAR